MAKKKWLLVLMVVLVAAGSLVYAFWDVIGIYTASKAVLSEALHGAMEDFRCRYEESPVSLLAGHIDPEGKYTAQISLGTENELLGQVRYDMTLRADTGNNRIAGQGIVLNRGKNLDMELYLDRDFMALSSGDLLGGTYYGITYDTFPEDLRSVPLVTMFVGSDTLSDWDSSVAAVQSMMNRSYRMPEMPGFTPEDIQQAMMAVILLPGQVTKVELPVEGRYVEGYRISYSAEGEQVGKVLGYLMDIGDGSGAQVHASFYLYEDQLVLMSLNGSAGGNSVRCALERMLEESVRTFRFSLAEGGETTGLCLRHKAQQQEGCLQEEWTFFSDFEGAGEGKTLRYRWEPVMGELTLASAQPVTLTIYETDAGLNVQTVHFERLMDVLSGTASDPEKGAYSCNLCLQRGAEVETPEYKNLDQWSLEDLMKLLGGVGNLIGFSSP